MGASAPDTQGLGDRLAWIFGSSRSGSTWLLRMLGDTGDVATIDDPHIGHHLGVWRPIPLAWAAGREIPELSTLTEVKREKPDYFFSDRYRDVWTGPLRDLIAARFEAQAEASEAARSGRRPAIVVKEPGSHAADLLLELFPTSTVIFLLRDGRDVVDSWLDAYQEGSWAQSEGAFPVAAHGRLPLVRWLASVWLFRTETVQRAYRDHNPDRRLLIRYEDLRDDPVAGLERIAATLDLEVSSDRLAEVAKENSFERLRPQDRGDGKEARAARPGSWRVGLSAAERRAADDIMGPKLAELGYAGEATAPAPVAA